jgi:hypothetical protein
MSVHAFGRPEDGAAIAEIRLKPVSSASSPLHPSTPLDRLSKLTRVSCGAGKFVRPSTVVLSEVLSEIPTKDSDKSGRRTDDRTQ